MEINLTYRTAQPEDAERIAAVIASGREQAYGLDPNSPAFEELVTSQLSEGAIDKLRELITSGPNKAFCEVAEVPDVGVIGVVIGLKHDTSDELDYLFVDKPYQGGGIGRSLLGRFSEWSGRDQTLWAVSYNVAAIRFYEHNGFRTVHQSANEDLGVMFTGMKRSWKEANA